MFWELETMLKELETEFTKLMEPETMLQPPSPW